MRCRWDSCASSVCRTIGLVLPPPTGIAVVAAAAGLALIQVGGLALHRSRGERDVIGLDLLLLLLTLVATWLATIWW
ncbi:hypothetical protein ABZ552_10915 [Nocardia sp. NPDC019219]|uniref:hypothetical protein n=1 Tax=Nocardia sp. NPDC019219 TaxID=3154590 RepID=UPI0033EF019E